MPQFGAKSNRTSRASLLRVPETGFDPAQTQDYYSNTIISHIFDAPLRYDFMARPVRLVPNTAAALPEVSTDFRTFTVRLTPGIFFQDDAAFKGQRRELIAADYVYSIKRVFDPRWKSQVLFILEAARIVGIERIRQRALKNTQHSITRAMSRVAGARPLHGSSAARAVEPALREYAGDSEPFGRSRRARSSMLRRSNHAHTDGTGPFRLAQWTRTSRIVLERNPTYHEEIYGFAAPIDSPQLAGDVERLRGRRVPLVDRVEVTIIQERSRACVVDQGGLDHLLVPIEYGTLVARTESWRPTLRGVACAST